MYLQVVNALVNGLTSLVLQLPAVIKNSHTQNSDPAEKNSYRNAAKMYITLLSGIVKTMEATQRQINATKISSSRGTKNKKNRKSAGAEKTVFEWAGYKERVLSALVACLENKSFFQLWKMSSPEGALGNLCLQTSLVLLESAENTRQAALRELTFQLCVLSAVKFNLHSRVPAALLHLLTSQHSEHLPAALPRMLQMASQRYNSPRLVADVIQDLVRVDTSIIARESAAARQVSTFLVECAACCPTELLPLIPLLLPLLDKDSYMLRNGVVQTIGSLLKISFSDPSLLQASEKENNDDENHDPNNMPQDDLGAKKSAKSPKKKGKTQKNKRKGKRRVLGELSEDEDEESSADEASAADSDSPNPSTRGNAEDEEEQGVSAMRGMGLSVQSRDNLLELLKERIHDVNSFTRSKVLQTWSDLATARVLPAQCYHDVAVLAAGRLKDKAANVRKFACVLLTRLLEYNPFSPRLALRPLESALETLGEEFKAALQHKQTQLGMKAAQVV